MIRRVLPVALFVDVASLAVPTTSASAAPSCVGRDVPVLAQQFHPFGRSFVSGLAQDGGAGDVLTFYAHADRVNCPA